MTVGELLNVLTIDSYSILSLNGVVVPKTKLNLIYGKYTIKQVMVTARNIKLDESDVEAILYTEGDLMNIQDYFTTKLSLPYNSFYTQIRINIMIDEKESI